MKKISTLIIVLVAATLATMAQPARSAQQVKERMNAAVQRLAGQQKPNRITEEDIMAACPDSMVTWQNDDDGNLLPNEKTVYTYDAQKRVASETVYAWNDDEEEGALGWTLTEYCLYSYYENSNRLETKYRKTSNYYPQETLTTYAWTVTNQIWTETVQARYEEGGDWSNYELVTNTYDEKDRLTETVTQQWTGDSWGNESRETLAYEGDKVMSTSYDWEGGLGWAAREYSVIYYNEQGLPYREESFEQDEETGEFVLLTVTEIAYDANGLPLLMKMVYDMGGGEMMEVGSGTFAYEFNDKGLPTKITSTMKIDYFGIYSWEDISVTYYYYGDGAHVDNAATEPVVTARRFYGMDGKETTGVNRGLYIVVTEYADGTRKTVKSVRR